MSIWVKDGVPFKNPLRVNGRQIWNPSDEELIDAGYTQEEPAPPPPQTVFTKLKIRRAMRQLGIEDKLNTLLAASETFAADWADAQDIDLGDPVLLQALQMGDISAEEIEQIKNIIINAEE